MAYLTLWLSHPEKSVFSNLISEIFDLDHQVGKFQSRQAAILGRIAINMRVWSHMEHGGILLQLGGGGG